MIVSIWVHLIVVRVEEDNGVATLERYVNASLIMTISSGCIARVVVDYTGAKFSPPQREQVPSHYVIAKNLVKLLNLGLYCRYISLFEGYRFGLQERQRQ